MRQQARNTQLVDVENSRVRVVEDERVAQVVGRGAVEGLIAWREQESEA